MPEQPGVDADSAVSCVVAVAEGGEEVAEGVQGGGEGATEVGVGLILRKQSTMRAVVQRPFIWYCTLLIMGRSN